MTVWFGTVHQGSITGGNIQNIENVPLVFSAVICLVFNQEAVVETCFAAFRSVFLCTKVTVHMRVWSRTFLIASCQGQRLRCAMCGMSEGLRLQCLQPTPESRAHCVAAEGEQRHFHWRNFGFLSIRRAALWARAVFICLCTAGLYGAEEACTFQTTSGGCINSHAWRNIKGRERIPPDDRDSQPVCVYWFMV